MTYQDEVKLMLLQSRCKFGIKGENIDLKAKMKEWLLSDAPITETELLFGR